MLRNKGAGHPERSLPRNRGLRRAICARWGGCAANAVEEPAFAFRDLCHELQAHHTSVLSLKVRTKKHRCHPERVLVRFRTKTSRRICICFLLADQIQRLIPDVLAKSICRYGLTPLTPLTQLVSCLKSSQHQYRCHLEILMSS